MWIGAVRAIVFAAVSQPHQILARENSAVGHGVHRVVLADDELPLPGHGSALLSTIQYPVLPDPFKYKLD
jgi:hypothetical protein